VFAHFTQCIKYGVEVDKNFAFGYLSDVVQAFGREVPNSIFRIAEANKQRFHELLHIRSNVDAEGYGGSSEPNQTTISDVQRI
jgi:hypothetical protein